jgi:1-acyl-sn-glycerol-3-phosphate acyltransferase
MKKFEQAFRALVVAFMIFFYLLFAFVGKLLIPEKKLRRAFFLRHVNAYAKAALRVIGIEVEIENEQHLQEGRTYLILANHMSYIDAMVMAAIRPMCFVTSQEVRETPVLGQITELGGCLFVERRSKENIRNEIGEIGMALQQGFHVVIFPEGTSSDGSKVLPFKRSLLVSAIDSLSPILPMVIQYEEIGSEKVSAKNRDALCWYGKMSFGPHFFALMALRRIKIRVKILPEIPVTKDSTRDILVGKAQSAINENYQPIV